MRYSEDENVRLISRRDEESIAPSYAESTRERFPEERVWRDVVWAVIFIIQLGIAIGLSGYAISDTYSKFHRPSGNDIDDGSITFDKGFADRIKYLSLVLLAAGLAVSTLTFFALKVFASAFIWIALLFPSIYSVIVEVLIFYYGLANTGNIAICCVVVGINLLYAYFVRNRVPFAASILKVSLKAISKYPSLLFVSAITLLTIIAWTALIVVTLSCLYLKLVNTDEDFETDKNNTLDTVSVYFLIFSFFWTSQVVGYLAFVTIDGVIAEWYFHAPNVSPRVTRRSAKRAFTTSFGSICFGAFFLAVVKMIRFLFNLKNRRSSSSAGILSCMFGCFLSFFEKFLKLFSNYSFSYVSIYGVDYCSAGKGTIELFQSRGFDVIINDSLLYNALNIVSWSSGALVATLLVLINKYLLKDYEILSIAFGIIGFFFGSACASIIFKAVRAAVTALYVCYAEDPVILNSTKPKIYHELTSAFNARFPDVTAKWHTI